MERFRTAFLDLAADLAHGAEPHPRTNAEEMALHLMTDRATVEFELGTCFPQRNRPRVGVRASVQSQVRQTHTPREVCRFGPVGRLLTQ